MSDALAARLWTYQAERFPLIQTVPLLAVFSASSINVSAVLADRALPGWPAYALGFLLAFALFFLMRVCDEVKDAEDDRRYRPERPVPRGLVSLGLLIRLGIVSAAAAILAALAWGIVQVLLLAGVLVWLAAMTAEFGVPAWLKARPVLYLLSHMAIMPLIDLMLTGVEWSGHGGPDGDLWVFLALSFVNGCVLEIGRKTWAPLSERRGVDSYSRVWGPENAAKIWLLTVALSAALLIWLGLILDQLVWFAVPAAVGLAGCIWVGLRFIREPQASAQKWLDHSAGLWVFLCYATAGFLPLLSGS
ncbi:MAG: UbiA family prenyltransferase [Pseudomonadota bacterium]